MKLSEKQQEFAYYFAALIGYANARGYKVSLGDTYRDPRVHGSFGTKGSYANAKSVHKLRLAGDLNLFVDGEYITDGDHPAYLDLGEYWEQCHPLARWGGRFNDANHFSFEHWGVK